MTYFVPSGALKLLLSERVRNAVDKRRIGRQALGAAEDESDIQAAKVARAEKKEELAEFDESIPWDEREVVAKRERDEQSKVEMELALLEKEVC